MGSPTIDGHLVDASVALALVLLMQAAYFWLQLRVQATYRKLHLQADIKSPSQLQMLIASAVILVAIGIVFLVLGFVFRDDGRFTLAYAMSVCCKGAALLGIWSSVVVEVLSPVRHYYYLGFYLFWGGLALQGLGIGPGIWQVVSSRREFLWATPVVTPICISIITGCALARPGGARPSLLWAWFFVGVSTSATGLGIAAGQVAGGAPVQCFLCGILLSLKAYRDWRKAKDREERLPPNEPRASPAESSEPDWFSACASEATSLTSLHSPRRNNYGTESGVEPLLRTPGDCDEGASRQTVAQFLTRVLAVHNNETRGRPESRDEQDLHEPLSVRSESSRIEAYSTRGSRVTGRLRLAVSQVSECIAGFIPAAVRILPSPSVPPAPEASPSVPPASEASPSVPPASEASPSVPPASEASSTETSGITVQQEVEQVTEEVPDSIRHRPSNNATWKRRFVTKVNLEILRPIIETLPTALIVTEARGTRYAEIAVTESCLDYLTTSTLRIPLHTESNFPDNQTAPTEGEIRVHGIATAKHRAKSSFVSIAKRAILSRKHGHGLDRYYLRYTSDRSVLAMLMWKILVRRILELNTADLRRFIQHCIFVGFSASSGIGRISKILERDEDAWLELFSNLHNEREGRPLKDPEAEIRLASLLWGLLESAENRGLSLYCLKYTPSRSARESLSQLASLMGDGVCSGLLYLDGIDKDQANQMLSRCRMFEGAGELHVASLTEQICKYVPLSPRGIARLPTGVSLTIQDEAAQALWTEMSYTYSSAPDISSPKDDLLVFLCCCLIPRAADAHAALCEWAASPEGHASFMHLKERLYDHRDSQERTVLRLLALVSFRTLHPSCRLCVAENPGVPVADRCLLASLQEPSCGGRLAGTDALRRMACALWRRVGGRCCPRTAYFFEMMEAGSPELGANSPSDRR